MTEREMPNPDPRCPKCGYTMCELADERQVTPLATIATPNGDQAEWPEDLQVREFPR